tara:strand:- start:139 stop:558 length:420 start_codon:yes stop_codon:yes gene_type:complete
MATKKTTSSKSTSSKKTSKVKKSKLENLQQTNGKSYEDQVAKARELEDILGISKISPFRTNDKNVFSEMLKDMNLTDLQSLAVKVGVFPSGNKTVLKSKIKRAFDSSLYGKGSIQVMGEPIKLDPSNPKHLKVIDFLNN